MGEKSYSQVGGKTRMVHFETTLRTGFIPYSVGAKEDLNMGGAFANKSVGRFDQTPGWSGSAEGVMGAGRRAAQTYKYENRLLEALVKTEVPPLLLTQQRQL